MLSGQAGQRYRNRLIEEQGVVSVRDDTKIESDKKRRSRIARWRWHFAYVMVKNPSLVLERQQRYEREALEKSLEPEVESPSKIKQLLTCAFLRRRMKRKVNSRRGSVDSSSSENYQI